MGVREWAELRLVEMLASLCAVVLLVAGLAAGLPFLRERIAEVFLYSFCCLSAVLLHAALDLGLRGVRGLARAASRRSPATPSLEPAAA
ncbi:MAG TPA: hypothetical protein VGD57_06905 [Candidatus Dormibacteraeota bacterium]